MKKVAIALLTAGLLLSIFGCNKQETTNSEPSQEQSAEVKYAEALDVLNTVLGAYTEDERFPMCGSDMEHVVMGNPGTFDITKTQELQSTLNLPADQIANLEDVATMVHMMNAHTFTGAAYRLKAGVDVNAFAEAVKTELQGTQWMCGFPDTVVIINAGGGYVVAAYGNEELIATFKTHALATLDGSKLITEAPVAD